MRTMENYEFYTTDDGSVGTKVLPVTEHELVFALLSSLDNDGFFVNDTHDVYWLVDWMDFVVESVTCVENESIMLMWADRLREFADIIEQTTNKPN